DDDARALAGHAIAPVALDLAGPRRVRVHHHVDRRRAPRGAATFWRAAPRGCAPGPLAARDGRWSRAGVSRRLRRHPRLVGWTARGAAHGTEAGVHAPCSRDGLRAGRGLVRGEALARW